jgi:general stress protein 26
VGRDWPKFGQGKADKEKLAGRALYQIGSDMIHLTITGHARFVEDPIEKKRVWESKIFDYDLGQFWPQGHDSKDFGLLLIEPEKAELTSLPAMTQGKSPELWRLAK